MQSKAVKWSLGGAQQTRGSPKVIWQPLAAQDLLWNLMIITLLQLSPISLTTLLQGELHLLNIDNTPCYKVSNKLLNELYQFLLYINLFLWMFLVRSPGLLYITKRNRGTTYNMKRETKQHCIRKLLIIKWSSLCHMNTIIYYRNMWAFISISSTRKINISLYWKSKLARFCSSNNDLYLCF